MSIDVGGTAPDFTLADQYGKDVSLRELIATGPVVLFFYPKDNTRGCTAEACAFRDEHQMFADAGAKVVGISSDSVASHAAFAREHQLSYTLLADANGRVRKAFGVPKTLGLVPGRVTYVIDRGGRVSHVFSSQLRPQAHVQQALAVLRSLS